MSTLTDRLLARLREAAHGVVTPCLLNPEVYAAVTIDDIERIFAVEETAEAASRETPQDAGGGRELEIRRFQRMLGGAANPVIGEVLSILDVTHVEVTRLTARVAELEAEKRHIASEYTEQLAAREAELPRLRAHPRVSVEEVIARLEAEAQMHRRHSEQPEDRTWIIWRSRVNSILRECWPAATQGGIE